MGSVFLAAGSTAKHSTSSDLFPLFIIVLFGVFYVTVIRPRRTKMRAAQSQQGQAMPGQRVRTTAGIYGTLVSGDDRDVVVEIAPGVEITMLRRGIMEVLPEDEQDGTGTFDPDPDTGAGYEPETGADYEPETAAEGENENENHSKPADDRGDLAV